VIEEEIFIRKAQQNDLDEIKALADSHKKELGFILRPVLARSIDQGELLVAANHRGIVGFIQYHHRRDLQTTLHNIVVKPDHRGMDVGQKLFSNLIDEARSIQQQMVLLKCPEELDANGFYARMGCHQVLIENGKARRLNVWQKEL
jgi:N-acetylglutamate synthase-like GNAT family acetyltransferase